ncbi:hypothetical protein E2C01_038958 [Portunus trituberculatus]|uniref:Uncharacterized protein n=1 Tax=Portunus trituberculatus TaxID=210409 RepID=A0A5B7FJE5_PORTR|nr:hypothetical protein [Portunus trituberculatus]
MSGMCIGVSQLLHVTTQQRGVQYTWYSKLHSGIDSVSICNLCFFPEVRKHHAQHQPHHPSRLARPSSHKFAVESRPLGKLWCGHLLPPPKR